MLPEDKEHLDNIKNLIKEKFGNLMISLYFYGSRTTCNKVDADFDILLITREKVDWKTEFELSRLIINYGIFNDLVIDLQILSSSEFESGINFHPYLINVKRTGVLC